MQIQRQRTTDRQTDRQTDKQRRGEGGGDINSEGGGGEHLDIRHFQRVPNGGVSEGGKN